ncbi:MAG: FtsX-like permease family protein [Spirochaetales bacterium]|nr:FtsX-like permease family protein [Spirochaetales bacterium]
MLVFKLAIKTILRRKRRMISIGVLVFIGTLFLVFGGTFAGSVEYFSRESVIDNFTGDFVVYAASSREKPSPFAFTTPLPNIPDVERVLSWLEKNPNVEAAVPIAQNYSIMAVDRDGARIELPLIYYAVEPARYRSVFDIVSITAGSYFGIEKDPRAGERGILVSTAQNERFKKSYNVELAPDERVTFLGVTPGGSVNAVSTRILGVYVPKRFASVFDYINFVDAATYSELYNFTGVAAGSLPAAYDAALSAESEDDIFAAADKAIAPLDVEKLKSETLSGYSMIAVRLKDHGRLEEERRAVENAGLGVSTEPWDQASGFYAPLARSLSLVVYVIVGVIFLIVAFIFMNTLIINIIERTHEIGTMRALGGEKGFVRSLFLSETLIVNGFFALLGAVASAALILAFGGSGVPLPDIVSQFLIGGGNLPLLLTPAPFLQAAAVVAVVSVLATLYPVSVATRISPLQALSQK